LNFDLPSNLDVPANLDVALALNVTLHVAVAIGAGLPFNAARSRDGVVASAVPLRVGPVSAPLFAPIRSLAALTLVGERRRAGQRAKQDHSYQDSSLCHRSLRRPTHQVSCHRKRPELPR
jgi:hypothetical protein